MSEGFPKIIFLGNTVVMFKLLNLMEVIGFIVLA